MAEAQAAKKQAVIVVHGMGEQRPMETLRGIVRAVWGTGSDGMLPGEDDKQAQEARRVWIVPDKRTGSLDLSRITTRANKNEVRTDFFEFYWADLFVGNTLQHMTSWLSRLLLRWPLHVPKDVFWAWIALWVLTVAAAVLTILAMLDGRNIFNAIWEMDWIVDRGPKFEKWLLGGLGSLVAFGVLKSRLSSASARDVEAVTMWNGLPAPNAPWSKGSPDLSNFMLFLVPSMLFLFLVYLFPIQLLTSANFWFLAAAAAIGLVIKSFVVPYMGDVARYTQDEPWAIEARARIRARGLGLLRELHGMNAEGQRVSGEGEYSRVVVVAHSLGSVVALDLLRYYWAEAGPVGKNPASVPTMEALAVVDTYVRSCSAGAAEGEAKAFDLAEYQKLQAIASFRLCESSPQWKITDFVTLGSPLTHAEFLIARDRLSFAKLVRDLILPQSPPMLDGQRKSFLYDLRHRRRTAKPADTRADHGALFAAVRWTNICDPARLVLAGDIFSGPLSENFGLGVADIRVKIKNAKRFFGASLGTILTHTEYWNPEAAGTLHATDGASTMVRPLDRVHITSLKAALDLGEPKH